MTGARTPGPRGERDISRKTIAWGMPDVSGASAVNTRVHTKTTKRTRGCGCIGHPAFPAPSCFRGTFFWHSSGSSCREIEDTRQRSCRDPSFETPRDSAAPRDEIVTCDDTKSDPDGEEAHRTVSNHEASGG